MLFFFFKQKTAYEVRISDWSSYVCSSDLKPMQSRTAVSTPFGPGAGSTTGTTCFGRKGRGEGGGGARWPEWSGLRCQETSYDLSHCLCACAQLRGVGPQCPNRSEERREGKEWVSTCRSRGSPYHKKNTKKIQSN